MSYPNIPPQQDRSTLISDKQPLLVAAAGPTRQSRATVAFRIILIIPHLVVLYFLGLVAAVVAFIGWFGALFTGRLPGFAAEYLSGYLRWYCRVAAYLLLLTDEYPPFLFQDAAYPVRVAVSPGRLSRLAVLFRIVLAIPAAILSMIAMSGLGTIVIFIAWLTALVAGKLPRSLHQAFAAVLRYGVRYYGYLYLLTDTYPRGLFGDKPGLSPNDPSGGLAYGMPGPAYGAPDPRFGAPDPRFGAPDPRYGPPDPRYGAPYAPYAPYGAPDPAYGQAAGYNAARGYGRPGYTTAAPGYGEPAAGYPTAQVARHRTAVSKTSSPPANWQMVLPASAKFLVGLVLVLGLATTVGAGISSRSVISSIRRLNDISQLNSAIAENNNAIHQNQKATAAANSALAKITSANIKLNSQMNRVVKATGACSSLGCINAQALLAARHISDFERKLHATVIPSASGAAASTFVPDVTRLKQSWMTMGHSASFTDFASKAGRAEKVGRRFDRDYLTLIVSLKNLSAALSRRAASLNQRSTSLNRQVSVLNAG